MKGCDYTNSFSMDSTHSIWCKQKGGLVPGPGPQVTCLQLSFTRLVAAVASSVCITCLGKVHHRTPILRHCPHLIRGQNAFPPSAGLDHLQSIIVPPSHFAPTSLPGWPGCFPLSSLTIAAGMAWRTATQPWQNRRRCAMRSHYWCSSFGILMCTYLLLILASNYCHSSYCRFLKCLSY